MTARKNFYKLYLNYLQDADTTGDLFWQEIDTYREDMNNKGLTIALELLDERIKKWKAKQ